MTKPYTQGVHHVGLAVPDLQTAEAFFVACLGWSTVGGRPEYPAVFVSDNSTRLTLWQVDPARASSFDRRRNVGLHHLALAVADRATLNAVYDRVKAFPDVSVEFAPEPVSQGSQTYHFICAMPGGVRIEFATAQ
jgi:catechol 2,3-dioxygenase-like lactoylglutathione lyase family enzyme